MLNSYNFLSSLSFCSINQQITYLEKPQLKMIIVTYNNKDIAFILDQINVLRDPWKLCPCNDILSLEIHFFLFAILMLIVCPGGNNASKKKLTQLEAAKTLKGFIAEGYLTKRGTRAQKGGRIGLGARLMMELEVWLEKNTNIESCTSCSKPVTISVLCTNK